MNEINIKLNQSIDRIYHVFRKYPLSEKCQMRIGNLDLRNLTWKGIEASGCDDLTKLSVNDLKHLLPRILELLIKDECSARPEVVLSAVGAVDRRLWQKNELSAIERFLLAGWSYLLNEPVFIERIDQWLCASLQVVDDPYEFISGLTGEWWIKPLPKAAHYARFIILNHEALLRGQMANPYWAGHEEQMLDVRARIITNYEIVELDTIISEHQYEPISDELRLAAHCLEDLCKLPHKERQKPPIPRASDFSRESRNAMQSGIEPIPPAPEHVELLNKAIESLYSTFEPYPHQADMIGSPASVPLRELTQSDLADFARDVLITFGQPQDLKHFLPRIFELILQPDWPIRPEGLIFKLLLADYNMWSQTERNAVETYVKAVWPILLCDPDYPVSAEEWLCGASSVVERGESVTHKSSKSMVVDKFMDLPHLWRTLCYEGFTPAMIHWARFIINNYETLLDGMKLRNKFWANRPYEVPRAVHWMLSAHNVASYLRSGSAKDHMPDEISRALEYASQLWKGRQQQRSEASDIAVKSPAEALELARKIRDPWYRCQELAGIARNTSNAQVRDTALRESFAAGAQTGERNRIVKVSCWPLGMLLDSGLTDWFEQELARLIDIIRKEMHPYRRIDALNWLLAPAYKGSPELYREVIEEIGRGAADAYGWRVAYLLLIASKIVDDFDHDGAVEIAMMIRNLRTRRRALRAINVQQLAEQYY